MGGRGSSSGATTASATTASPATRLIRQAAQAGGGAGGTGGAGASPFQMNNQPPKQVATPQQAKTANNATFPDTDNSPYHDLKGGRAYFQSQNFTVSQAMATMDYIDPATIPGSLYNMGQTLNWKMSHGYQLTAQEQYVESQLMGAMHNVGQNINLTRYDHAGIADTLLKQVGVRSGLQNASLSDLQKLVGTQFKENKFLSTSYNDFKNLPPGDPFRNRQVKITYHAKANTQALMPGDTTDRSGQKVMLGEMILSPTNKFKVVGVREIKKTGARLQGSQNYSGRQIELIVEAEG